MGKRVKCHITGEIGSSDTFIKIGSYYYKSQEIYDADKKKKQNRLALIDYVCREFLNYEEGAPFSTFLPRKLQELKYYDDELILQAFKEQADTIRQRFDVMQFPNELNKISYMIGIVRNALPDALSRYRREEKQRRQTLRTEEFSLSEMEQTPRKKGKDLSRWLEEDDL